MTTTHEFLLLKEVCNLFKIGHAQGITWIKHGKLKPVQVIPGARMLFRRYEIEQLVKEMEEVA